MDIQDATNRNSALYKDCSSYSESSGSSWSTTIIIPIVVVALLICVLVGAFFIWRQFKRKNRQLSHIDQDEIETA